MKPLKITLAQLNLIVGDIDNNAQKIIAAAVHARDELKADLVVFHELTISNYSPEDLLYHQDLYTMCKDALNEIAQATQGIDVVLGYPEATGDVDSPLTKTRFNSAAWLRDGKLYANYRKQRLPNYAVFDEKRYFSPGSASVIIEIKGYKIGMLICEDLWHAEPIAQAKAAGAQLIVSPNASPFSTTRHQARIETLKKRVKANGIPIIYVNQVGGHDELLFDGSSMVIDKNAEICCSLAHCEENIATIEVDENINIKKQNLAKELSLEESVYKALVLGTRDYVQKNGFFGAIIGLSGGIDSALTLAIAVDALGAENVTAVMMPSRYTSDLSKEAALAEAKALKVEHHIIPIEPAFKALLASLREPFAGLPEDTTEENLQARVRGTLLMALSNKTGRLVLTTGNKSEMAVGYATLYGDMAGGFAVLKDVYKTLVYKLAVYRNQISQVIPQAVIERPPTAELAPDQKDEDSLPPYAELDRILQLYIEENYCLPKIVAKGFNEDTVRKVMTLVNRSEYKRRQSAPGTRVTNKGFGRDWRYPITSKYLRNGMKKQIKDRN